MTDALHAITTPVTTATGARIPGLRLVNSSHALLAALPLFRLQPHGFTNKDLRTLVADLRAISPQELTTGQMTYDLRRGGRRRAGRPGDRPPGQERRTPLHHSVGDMRAAPGGQLPLPLQCPGGEPGEREVDGRSR